MAGSVLLQAVTSRRVSQVRYLLKQGISADTCSPSGDCALLVALRLQDDSQRKIMFNLLIQNGADIHIRDRSTGRSVLAWACALGRAEQLRRLLAQYPGEFDLCGRDLSGLIPLHHACRAGSKECVRILVREMVRYGIPVDVPGEAGMTAFLEAHRLGFHEIANILEKEGKANPQQFDLKTFRTKTPWALEGKSQRDESQLEKLLADMKIRGRSNLQSLEFLARDGRSPGLPVIDVSGGGAQTTVTSISSSRFPAGGHGTSFPSLVRTNTSQNIASSTLPNLRSGKVAQSDGINHTRMYAAGSLADVSFAKQTTRVNPADFSSSRFSSRNHHKEWNRVQTLLSWSDNAHDVGTDNFASSVNVDASSEKTHSGVMPPTAAAGMPAGPGVPSGQLGVIDFMAAMADQMSPSYCKPVVPKPPKPKPSFKQRKLNVMKRISTLAFILRSMRSNSKKKGNTRNINTRAGNRLKGGNSRVRQQPGMAYRPRGSQNHHLPRRVARAGQGSVALKSK